METIDAMDFFEAGKRIQSKSFVPLPDYLSRSDFHVMWAVHTAEEKLGKAEIALNELAKYEIGHKIGPTAISRTLKSLENKKLLIRRKDPSDKRVTYVSLTSEGKKLAEEIFDISKNFWNQVITKLGDNIAKRLVADMNKLADAIDDVKKDFKY